MTLFAVINYNTKFKYYQGKTWTQFYLGYGHKTEIKPFFPKLTQTIQRETDEKEEQTEVIFNEC